MLCTSCHLVIYLFYVSLYFMFYFMITKFIWNVLYFNFFFFFASNINLAMSNVSSQCVKCDINKIIWLFFGGGGVKKFDRIFIKKYHFKTMFWCVRLYKNSLIWKVCKVKHRFNGICGEMCLTMFSPNRCWTILTLVWYRTSVFVVLSSLISMSSH